MAMASIAPRGPPWQRPAPHIHICVTAASRLRAERSFPTRHRPHKGWPASEPHSAGEPSGSAAVPGSSWAHSGCASDLRLQGGDCRAASTDAPIRQFRMASSSARSVRLPPVTFLSRNDIGPRSPVCDKLLARREQVARVGHGVAELILRPAPLRCAGRLSGRPGAASEKCARSHPCMAARVMMCWTWRPRGLLGSVARIAGPSSTLPRRRCGRLVAHLLGHPGCRNAGSSRVGCAPSRSRARTWPRHGYESAARAGAAEQTARAHQTSSRTPGRWDGRPAPLRSCDASTGALAARRSSRAADHPPRPIDSAVAAASAPSSQTTRPTSRHHGAGHERRPEPNGSALRRP